MSSVQTTEVSTANNNPAPTSLSSLSSNRTDEKQQQQSHHDAPVDQNRLFPDQLRQVVRLTQCPICSSPLRDPLTLPCGRSLCRTCIPSSYLRTSISYPATANRLQGFQCPFADCAKEHALGDCSPDVTLRKALAVVDAELERARASPLAEDLSTHVVIKDQWEATGVPSLRGVETTSRLLQGGRLVATFSLAQKGELKYNDEVTYMSPVTPDQAAFDSSVLTTVKDAVRSEMDCQVCYALYYDPVTTPCGHTFCRSCLQRVLDHARYCPVCRRVLSVEPVVYREECPTNQLLARIIASFWADLLEARRQAVIAEGLSDGAENYDIAVFICTLSFPSMPTFLHVFEPRYRLMIRRALEGDRTFGMVLYQQGRGFRELGTLLRIVNVEFFPDGRSLIETVGVSRFRIVEHSTLDGYTVAKIQKINDVSIAAEEELEALETRNRRREVGGTTTMTTTTTAAGEMNGEIESAATSELMEFGVDFVRRMREQSVGWLTTRMLAIYGECPSDPALFPWWFANVLPVKDSEKYRLLGTTTVRERLKICCEWVLEWERNTW
ncbi:ATP-dependent protease La domain-containing protein [Bombardia bombarda]|uniref:ATP-dependent protease La domain-containing protein n=1 Tax=Bombardia bombarda TaxID=252184 RepID=A0AA40CG65_9PEZI|nr:ATP-dependent protease La domain-containing protein [Bombardia bombarda]